LIVGDIELDEAIDTSFPIFMRYGVYLSPIVMSRDCELIFRERTGFIRSVLRDGVLMYAKA
jgi:hypothetical protein